MNSPVVWFEVLGQDADEVVVDEYDLVGSVLGFDSVGRPEELPGGFGGDRLAQLDDGVEGGRGVLGWLFEQVEAGQIEGGEHIALFAFPLSLLYPCA